MTKLLRIWTVTDGRAGNLAQADGLARAILRRRPAEIQSREIRLSLMASRIPAWLSWRLGARANGWPFSGISRGRDELSRPWPDLAIGAGRRVAPVVAALGRLYDVRTVQLLDPQMPARAFDAVIVPEHDRLEAGNVLRSTGALNRMTAADVTLAARNWRGRFDHLTKPRLAVLVGGPSRSSGFDMGDGKALVEALTELAPKMTLLITPSRRTPALLVEILRSRLGPRAFVWDGGGDNPYPAILGHAAAVLVTADSVNMASEAATTGLPVHVFPVAGLAPKMTRFHESLARAGISRPFTGEIGDWTYEPLAEADRIAGLLAERGLC